LETGNNNRRYYPDGSTPAERRLRTAERTRRLRDAGYTVHEIYEHSVRPFFARNPELMKRVDQQPWLKNPKLDCENALRGGMTLPVCLYYECGADETIELYDYKSNYPFCQAKFAYPIGAPIVYIAPNVPPIEKLFGLLYCTILPPENLHVPPLAANYHKKLLGVLCNQCALDKNEESCTHTPAQRAITNTWTTPEISLALLMGYKILAYHEAWHYPQKSQYVKPKFPGEITPQGLFAKFVFTFYKLKTEAEGFKENMTPADREKFCNDFFTSTGVALDSAAISKNDVTRSTCKIILNSLW